MPESSNKINVPKVIDWNNFGKQLLIAEKIIKEINIESYTQNINDMSHNCMNFSITSYKSYSNERDIILKNINKQLLSFNNPKEILKRIQKTTNNSYIPTPIELLTNTKLTREEFEEINKEFYEISWEKIFNSSILKRQFKKLV